MLVDFCGARLHLNINDISAANNCCGRFLLYTAIMRRRTDGRSRRRDGSSGLVSFHGWSRAADKRARRRRSCDVEDRRVVALRRTSVTQRNCVTKRRRVLHYGEIESSRHNRVSVVGRTRNNRGEHLIYVLSSSAMLFHAHSRSSRAEHAASADFATLIS